MTRRRPLAAYVCAIDYVEQAWEADLRMRRGEHQHECRHCSMWYWPMHKHEHEQGHDPEPSGVEINRSGHAVRVRTRKKPCIDCADAHADWDRVVAASDRTAAEFIARQQ